MSLKAINESYRPLLAVDGRGLYKETFRHLVAKLLAGVASNRGKVTIGWAANDGNATERVKTYLYCDLS